MLTFTYKFWNKQIEVLNSKKGFLLLVFLISSVLLLELLVTAWEELKEALNEISCINTACFILHT